MAEIKEGLLLFKIYVDQKWFQHYTPFVNNLSLVNVIKKQTFKLVVMHLQSCYLLCCARFT